MHIISAFSQGKVRKPVKVAICKIRWKSTSEAVEFFIEKDLAIQYFAHWENKNAIVQIQLNRFTSSLYPLLLTIYKKILS